jgi:phage tail-like protein
VSRRSDWLLAQLPMGMLDDDFFVRFVSLFQEVATTLLDGAANIEHVVDLTVAPPELVRWLGSWLAVTSIDASLPEQTQRMLVHQAGRTLAWRGTRRGLDGFLSAVTGAPVEIDESGWVRRDLQEEDERTDTDLLPRVAIRVASLGWLSEADFVELVADEIPANVAWELHLGERQLWPVTAAVGSSGTEASTP